MGLIAHSIFILYYNRYILSLAKEFILMKIKAKKWHPSTECYRPYLLPIDEVTMLTTDMDKIIQCARCAKTMSFGSSYTSLHIHDGAGFGYPVCEQCYADEAELERNN